MAELRDYQVRAARTAATALAHYGASLDASDTGVGKTYTACGLAAGMKRPVGIICPKPVIPTWEGVLDAFGVKPLFLVNYEKLVRGNTPWGTWKHRKFVWSAEVPQEALLIWDEVHRCKSPTSKNGKMLRAAKPFYNHMLSATAAQSAMDLRVIGEMLQLFRNDDYYWWARNHGCVSAGFSVLQLSDNPLTVAKANEKIHQMIFGTN